ncbi:MAG: hypothetical protein RLZZ414_1549, partial [Bacteroidota bacterium]
MESFNLNQTKRKLTISMLSNIKNLNENSSLNLPKSLIQKTY